MARKIYNHLITALSIGVVFILMTSCEGPAGPSGKDGKDANTVCLKCHNSVNQSGKLMEYHLSKKYLDPNNAVARGQSSKYCARCHTNEGFQEIISEGVYVCSNSYPDGTKITCETCHQHHSFDFADDTVSFVLRTIAPVSLNYYNHTKTQDFGKINNLCAQCHQIRGVTTDSVYNQTKDKVKVAYLNDGKSNLSKYADKSFNQLPFFPLVGTNPNDTVQYRVGQAFSVHDGNQSNLNAGINAYEYPGVSYTRIWKHSSYSCTDCHMNKFDSISGTGGHSMIPNTAECAKCHTSDHLASTTLATKALLDQLGQLLTARKVFKATTSNGVTSYTAENTHDYNGKLLGTGNATDTFAIALTAFNTVSIGPSPSATDLITYQSYVSYKKDADFALRIGRPWKYGELGAAYNYFYIFSESPEGVSFGVHNPVYAQKVLQSSIDWLNSNP